MVEKSKMKRQMEIFNGEKNIKEYQKDNERIQMNEL